MKKEEKKEEVKEMVNPIDQLFDPNNSDNIVLYNDKDEPIEFEQIAIIPLDNANYAILQPVKKLEGLQDDEAFAFEVVEDEENGDTLQLVEDDALIDRIFDEYKELYNNRKRTGSIKTKIGFVFCKN